MWILLVFIYSLLKGSRDLIKKKALQKSTAAEVLLLYSAAGFLLLLPDLPEALQTPPAYIPLVALKALVLFAAYLCAFHAIQNLAISLYGVVDLSRMVFSLLLGVVLLHEPMGLWQILGAALVAAGMLLLRSPGQKHLAPEKNSRGKFFLLLAFVQSFLNACSSILDKISVRYLTSAQLQFWFMLFLLLFYVIYALVTRVRIQWRTALKNYWILLIAVLFVFADRLLFLANAAEGSSVIIMTLLKRSGCIVTILGGRLFFGEKHICRKLLCAAVMLAGILLAVLLPA